VTTAEAAKPTPTKIVNTTERPTELAAVPGSALADLCASLSEQKDRYDGYKLQSERSGNIGWAARYGDIADVYEHCIDRIEALMSKPNSSDRPGDAANGTLLSPERPNAATP